ncbi:protein phosphatase 2C domain-containing protein [Solwaraspora sp. WMMD791]|uniref:protein phosphatase 2C domain-containing protein n=1 Tax=Solwaraspora sp. WMMD791 TaxID=3016086 RepID=UPI002499D46F|nr:protein phosphatase 2C domain-containing protein [Solwaraspora sp. WMMD791]WFE26382.1 protein phosphatase 2C domain-containing protein [Solwaraspora sp. WMMD791]
MLRVIPAVPTMRVDACSVAAGDQPDNEDQMLQYGDLVAVLDGATAPAGFDTGCRHGPAWYVRRLAAQLTLAAATAPADPLATLLAEAVRAVRGDHGGDCDLGHPGTPSSTVCLLRRTPGHLDYLVLCDSPLVVDVAGQVGVVADDRLAATMARLWQREPPATGTSATGTSATGTSGTGTSGTAAAEHADYRRAVQWQRQHTNTPDGYWVAAADPAAADRALCGTLPLTGPGRVRRAALLTDGATRAVDLFGLLDWPGLLDLLASAGPAELIRRVRAAETDGAVSLATGPRHKRHDDATAVFCLFDGG